MPGLFVTATGTDVGKTYVTAGLIRAGRRAGRPMEALKPVLTGYDPATAESGDAGRLLAALGRAVTREAIETIAPHRFAAPLAPSMAAPMERRRLEPAAVAASCRAAVQPKALTLIEGIGGVMVPLDGRSTVLDLICALALPVLLVSGTQLGALSHCMTAHAALTGRGITPALVVLNESAGSTVPLDMTRETLAGFFCEQTLAVLPRDATEPDFDRLLVRLIAALDRHPSRSLASLA